MKYVMSYGCRNIALPPPGNKICTVVASADTPFELGTIVDASDIVIRMNDAPTRGFERIVEAKTTHRIINSVSPRVWAGIQTVKSLELRHPYRNNAFDPSMCYNVTCVLEDVSRHGRHNSLRKETRDSKWK
jgi:hypothetical protein